MYQAGRVGGDLLEFASGALPSLHHSSAGSFVTLIAVYIAGTFAPL
jgi:hypothetical protein